MSIQLICKLTTPELQRRRATVIAELKQLLHSKEEITNGVALAFPSEDKVLDALIAFIKSERLCCDFLSFRLDVDNEIAKLEITGPDGTEEFLQHEVGF